MYNTKRFIWLMVAGKSKQHGVSSGKGPLATSQHGGEMGGEAERKSRMCP